MPCAALVALLLLGVVGGRGALALALVLALVLALALALALANQLTGY